MSASVWPSVRKDSYDSQCTPKGHDIKLCTYLLRFCWEDRQPMRQESYQPREYIFWNSCGNCWKPLYHQTVVAPISYVSIGFSTGVQIALIQWCKNYLSNEPAHLILCHFLTRFRIDPGILIQMLSRYKFLVAFCAIIFSCQPLYTRFVK